MKLKTSLILALPTLSFLVTALQAAETPPEENSLILTTVITPRVFGFQAFRGWLGERALFLEQYNYLEGFSGDNRSDFFADLEVDVTANNDKRDIFVLERKGFGQHNHRGKAKYSNDVVNVTGFYSHYRSAVSGIDYLLNPDLVAGGEVSSGPYQVFNNDANRFDYHIDRTTYGAGLKVKPTLLGDLASISIDYEGYKRDGNKFATFFLDTPGLPSNTGWRGINLNVDEHVNKIGVTLTASPKKLFEVAYEVSFEQFVSDVGELQMERDVLGPVGVDLSGVGANARISSFFYVPDTNLFTHGIRINKNFNDRLAVSAGYGASWLEQDSFTQRESTATPPHTKNQISSDHAFVTANANVSPTLSVEGNIKYYNRENDSTFPDGLIGSGAGPNRLVAPRINDIESLEYGLAANWRPGMLGSNITFGWRHLDRERDLTFGTTSEDIAPPQTLYREDTLSDEIYLKWIARPAGGWTMRVTPSYTWADKTGLVAEPEEALSVKTLLSYAAPTGWLASAFYDYKHKENSNNTFTDAVGPLPLDTYTQNVDSVYHSAGLSLNVMPKEDVNIFANLYWAQDDFSTYLFTTNTMRWAGAQFTLEDQPNYKINSYVFSLGGDWQVSDKLRMTGSYTFSKSEGDVASGTVFTELQNATGSVDSIIDNLTHSISLGADYVINPKTTLRVNYTYEHYDDDAYILSSGVNMLAIGLSFRL